jgi:hypothetical protein
MCVIVVVFPLGMFARVFRVFLPDVDMFGPISGVLLDQIFDVFRERPVFECLSPSVTCTKNMTIKTDRGAHARTIMVAASGVDTDFDGRP